MKSTPVVNGSQPTTCALLLMMQRLQREGVPLRAAHLGVLVLVLDNLNDDECYTRGHDYLMARTGDGRKAIIRIMAALVKAGLLNRERRGGKESGPSCYRALMSKSAQVALVSKSTREHKSTGVETGIALVSKSTRTDPSSSPSVREPRSGALSGVRDVPRVAVAADNGKSTAPVGAARALRPKPRTTNPKVFEAMVWQEFKAHPTMDPGDFKDRVRTVAAQQAIDYTLDQLAGMLDKVDARRDRQERTKSWQVSDDEKARRREARRHPDRAGVSLWGGGFTLSAIEKTRGRAH